jgi:mannose-6-phosphate isomerase-like protein (cupin superfamily)
METAVYRLVEVLQRAPSPNNLAAEIAKHGSVEIEFYQPKAEDRQTPHDRDELYVVARGSGTFDMEGAPFAFQAGDAIFVPAHAVHRFSSFSDDFATWVAFF